MGYKARDSHLSFSRHSCRFFANPTSIRARERENSSFQQSFTALHFLISKKTSMKTNLLAATVVVCMSSCLTLARTPSSGSRTQPRQALNLDLIDNTPDPLRLPDDDSGYDPIKAIQSVVAEVEGHPPKIEIQPKKKREIYAPPHIGYTENIPLRDAAIDAPPDCNNKVCFCISSFDHHSR